MDKSQEQVLLLDDESASLAYSQRAIARFVPEDCIHTAATVEECMDILREIPIDLAFLDVELTHSDGFTLSQYIRRQYPDTKVVILTGHVDLGAKSYDYEPFDFLTKPVDVLRLERTFQRAREARAQAKTAPGRIVIDTSTGFVLLSPEEILYITKTGNTCVVHCENGEEYRTVSSLDKLEKTLEDRGFFRTHQSFLVPADRIREVKPAVFGNSYEAVLTGGTTVPVSRNKFSRLKTFLLQRSTSL